MIEMSAGGLRERIRDGAEPHPRFQRQSVFVGGASSSGAPGDDGEDGRDADVSAEFSPEPEFSYKQMGEQFVIHALFPLSLPAVLVDGGAVRARNQQLLPVRRSVRKLNSAPVWL